jgi:hypothetical protein
MLIFQTSGQRAGKRRAGDPRIGARQQASRAGGTGLAPSSRRRRQRMSPDRDVDKEPAEGSRETVDEALKSPEDRQQGVSNRPRQEEQREQDRLPPRGEPKVE